MQLPGEVPAASAAPAAVPQWALAGCRGLTHVRMREHSLPPKEGGNVFPRLQ